MAQQEHRFSKLRLDTPTAPNRVSSAFSAFRRSSGNNGDNANLYTTEHANSAPQLPLASLTKEDSILLVGSPHLEEDLSKRLRNGEDFEDSVRSEVSDVIASSPGASEFSNEETGGLRSRGTSISFAREITTEDGDKQLLDTPLPRSAPRDVPQFYQHGSGPHSSLRVETGLDDVRDEDSESVEDSLLLDRRKERIRFTYGDEPPQHLPIEPSTEDTQLPDNDRTASLTSATTASTVLEEISTPLNDVLLSPAHAKTTSPIEFQSQQIIPGWPARRSESTRSRSYNRISSLVDNSGPRSSGRRRSTRSAASSMSSFHMSPASRWLAAINASTEESLEPDDEGQEIGDHSGWIIGRKIGFGGFSEVKEVYTMENDKRVVRAVKIVRKNPPQLKEDEKENERLQASFEHEVQIWRFLKHKYILPLISVYDTPFATFCITNLNVGGTLHDLLRARRHQYESKERGLGVTLAKRYTYQLAAALRYLHEDVRVVHRDVKLENCLIDMTAPNAKTEGGNVLLCDFGMADFIKNEDRDRRMDEEAESTDGKKGKWRQSHHRNIGPSNTSSHLDRSTDSFASTEVSNTATPSPTEEVKTKSEYGPPSTFSIMGSVEYASPEVVTASQTLYSPPADIWALGVIIYTLLTGSLPFKHSMREKLVVMIEKTQWDTAPLYECRAFRESGSNALGIIELVKGCLTADADERWDIRQVLGCRWLRGCREFYGDGSEDDDGGAGGWK